MPPRVTVGDAQGIPVIDLSSFLDGSAKQDVADAVLSSFQEVGFVYLVNHGLEPDKVATMFDWSKRFFSQPTEIKQLAPHPPSGTHHRGYSGLGAEKITQHVYDNDELDRIRKNAPDVKESFECGREDDPVMPNIWLPDGVLPGFREACLDFYWTCDSMKKTVLRLLETGLHLPEDFLVKLHKAADNQLRLLHYPSVSVEQIEREEVTRIGAHSDFGSITLLLQDNAGGLEIEDPNQPGSFKSIPPVEGAIMVNAGDFLMRWSNDTIRSTIHRVRAPPDLKGKAGMTPERYSVPYFCSADFTTVVDCLPGTFSNENPKKYEPISAVGYIMQRLSVNY